nr:BREX-1 system phosphatase PglZ type A [uncultured Prevotella sp.]
MSISLQDTIQQTLVSKFENHRIVFWYDENGDTQDLFDAINLDGVEKVSYDENGFTLKYKMTEEKPKQKFLVYWSGQRPDDEANWLLDLQLGGASFSADSWSLYASESHVNVLLREKVIKKYEAFFKEKKNRENMANRLQGTESEEDVVWTIITITAGTDGSIDSLLYKLSEEEIGDKQPVYARLTKYNLDNALWERITQYFVYNGNNRSIRDLLIWLFRQDMYSKLGKISKVSPNVLLFMSKWKDSKQHGALFKKWSRQLENDLNIRDEVSDLHLTAEQMLPCDTFFAVVGLVASEAAKRVQEKTITPTDFGNWIHQLQNNIFYDNVKDYFEALLHACTMINLIDSADLTIETAKQGFEAYYKQWYCIDQEYRLFLQEEKLSKTLTPLKPIEKIVVNKYTSDYLYQLAVQWQKQVDGMSKWTIDGVLSQQRFYNRYVQKYASQYVKSGVFVVISDGMRYESMMELQERINSLNSFSTKMEQPLLGMLPSYTQLGMAALLPHKSLEVKEGTALINADGGQSTAGKDNRMKILQKQYGRSYAIKADDFLAKPSHYWRDFFKDYDVVYIYSNVIDDAGHKDYLETEAELEHLIRITKHIANANRTNIIYTADHGYIYQNDEQLDSDFVQYTPPSDAWTKDRRFVIGKNLSDNNDVNTWTAQQVGLSGDIMVQTVKGLGRIRISGASKNYIHGGTMPQEIAIPVLIANRSRKTDIKFVDVDIIGSSRKILTGNITISLYQMEEVSEKVKPRELRIGFYDKNNNLISDVFTQTFNIDKKESANREVRHRFEFTQNISELNGQDVYLIMQEPVERSSTLKTYRRETYHVDLPFMPEF